LASCPAILFPGWPLGILVTSRIELALSTKEISRWDCLGYATT